MVREFTLGRGDARMVIMCSYRLCFFFQAEDVIRNAQESRGLGDVYEGQLQRRHLVQVHWSTSQVQGLYPAGHGDFSTVQRPVSYTHLTLPTIYSV